MCLKIRKYGILKSWRESIWKLKSGKAEFGIVSPGEMEEFESEIIEFRGHRNILALHRNTIEITKDEEISRRADCIVGVRATKSCSDLSRGLKETIRRGAGLTFELQVGQETFSFFGQGSPSLTLSDTREIVLRRSDFLSDRTGALRCNASAKDIPRRLVAKLQDPSSEGILCIRPSHFRTQLLTENAVPSLENLYNECSILK